MDKQLIKINNKIILLMKVIKYMKKIIFKGFI